VHFTHGALQNRVETRIALVGEGADANLHTIQLTGHAKHTDSTTIISHDVPHCTSNQHCRIIVDDQAKATFQGKTIVAQDAQKTDSKQLNKNLLLSRKAEVNSKPELEIYADDVACSHGSTSGAIDEEALFYLRSRGVPQGQAQDLLVLAFLAEAIEEIEDEQIADEIRDRLDAWLQRHRS
jgi:Fe-S cluster assembly protein SufD